MQSLRQADEHFSRNQFEHALKAYRSNLHAACPLPARANRSLPRRPYLQLVSIRLRIGSSLASQGRRLYAAAEYMIALQILEDVFHDQSATSEKDPMIELKLMNATVRLIEILSGLPLVSSILARCSSILRRLQKGRSLTVRDPRVLHSTSTSSSQFQQTQRRTRRRIRLQGRVHRRTKRIPQSSKTLLDRLIDLSSSSVNPSTPLPLPTNTDTHVSSSDRVFSPSSPEPTKKNRSRLDPISRKFRDAHRRKLKRMLGGLRSEIRVLYVDLCVRGIVARKPFEVGERLLTETMSMFVSINTMNEEEEEQQQRCEFCGLSLGDDSFSCPSSCGLHYCSNSCYRASSSIYHQKVCVLKRRFGSGRIRTIREEEEESHSEENENENHLLVLMLEKLYSAIIQRDPGIDHPLEAIALCFPETETEIKNENENDQRKDLSTLLLFNSLISDPSRRWLRFSPYLSFDTTRSMVQLIRDGRVSVTESRLGLSTFGLLCSKSRVESEVNVECRAVEDCPNGLAFVVVRPIARGDQIVMWREKDVEDGSAGSESSGDDLLVIRSIDSSMEISGGGEGSEEVEIEGEEYSGEMMEVDPLFDDLSMLSSSGGLSERDLEH